LSQAGRLEVAGKSVGRAVGPRKTIERGSGAFGNNRGARKGPGGGGMDDVKEVNREGDGAGVGQPPGAKQGLNRDSGTNKLTSAGTATRHMRESATIGWGSM